VTVPIWLTIFLAVLPVLAAVGTQLVQGHFNAKAGEREERLFQKRLDVDERRAKDARQAQHVDRVIPAYAALLESAHKVLRAGPSRSDEEVDLRRDCINRMEEFVSKSALARIYTHTTARVAIDRFRAAGDNYYHQMFDDDSHSPEERGADPSPLRGALRDLEEALQESLDDWRFGSARPTDRATPPAST
jgi:hypothetical protein